MKRRNLFNDAYKRTIVNSSIDSMHVQRIIEEGFLRTLGNAFRGKESIKTSSERLMSFVLQKIGLTRNTAKIDTEANIIASKMHSTAPNFCEEFSHYILHTEKPSPRDIINVRAHVAYISGRSMQSDTNMIGAIVIELFNNDNEFVEGTDAIMISKSDNEPEIEKRIMNAIRTRRCGKLATVLARYSDGFKELASKYSVQCKDPEMESFEVSSPTELLKHLEDTKAAREEAAKKEEEEREKARRDANAATARPKNRREPPEIDVSDDDDEELTSQKEQKRRQNLLNLYNSGQDSIDEAFSDLVNLFDPIISFIDEIPNNENAIKIYKEARHQLRMYEDNDKIQPAQRSKMLKIVKFIETAYLLKNITTIEGTFTRRGKTESFEHQITFRKYGYNFLNEEDFDLIDQYHTYSRYSGSNANKLKLFMLLIHNCNDAFETMYNGINAMLKLKITSDYILEPEISLGTAISNFANDVEACYDKLDELYGDEGVLKDPNSIYGRITKKVRSILK